MCITLGVTSTRWVRWNKGKTAAGATSVLVRPSSERACRTPFVVELPPSHSASKRWRRGHEKHTIIWASSSHYSTRKKWPSPSVLRAHVSTAPPADLYSRSDRTPR